MSHTLGAITIPRGMLWTDEFDWTAVESSSERGVTGALIVDAAVKTGGRPITLEGQDDQGHIRRSVLLALQALADDPVATHTLTLADGRAFTVRFAPNPITATPIGRPELPTGDNRYVATIRLQTV